MVSARITADSLLQDAVGWLRVVEPGIEDLAHRKTLLYLGWAIGELKNPVVSAMNGGIAYGPTLNTPR
jgi:hypothetical protein